MSFPHCSVLSQMVDDEQQQMKAVVSQPHGCTRTALAETIAQL